MKRSEINQILRDMDAFLEKRSFPLPPFAYWSPDEWKKKGPEVSEIVDRRLGWDITDFGQNDFCKCGLAIFTLRNGIPGNTDHTKGKVYCEKVLMFRRDQVCPFHFHWVKMEDIINRGGGELMVQVCNADAKDGLADTPVTLGIDGTLRTVDARTELKLEPGESATLTPRTYHRITGRKDNVLVVEVSLVNDDDRDNRFLDKVGRFATVEEDEPPVFLLREDYAKYYPLFGK
jgi:D-lyxose ketol-isomerase